MKDSRIVIVGIVIVILIAGASIAFLGRGNDTGESKIVSVPDARTRQCPQCFPSGSGLCPQGRLREEGSGLSRVMNFRHNLMAGWMIH